MKFKKNRSSNLVSCIDCHLEPLNNQRTSLTNYTLFFSNSVSLLYTP